MKELIKIEIRQRSENNFEATATVVSSKRIEGELEGSGTTAAEAAQEAWDLYMLPEEKWRTMGYIIQ